MPKFPSSRWLPAHPPRAAQAATTTMIQMVIRSRGTPTSWHLQWTSALAGRKCTRRARPGKLVCGLG